MRLSFKIVLLFCAAIVPLHAQTAPPNYQAFSDSKLDQLLGPLALYPDPLLAQILPAAGFPAQITLADRYLTGGGSPDQIAQQPWDASVQAVAHYPAVLKWMDDNLSVTTELGEAFLYQQPAVMASVQRLRASAQSLGNLQSTPQQQVETDGGNIDIDPANPQEIYVPNYQPDQVYFQRANGGSFITFGSGYGIGLWLNNDFDWRGGRLLVWSQAHPRPADWWHEPPARRNRGQAVVWHPAFHPVPAAVQRGDRGRVVTAPRPEAKAALIGVQSAQETRNYSARGQESLHAVNRPEPAARPAQAGRPDHR